jgi:hypothetical protein
LKPSPPEQKARNSQNTVDFEFKGINPVRKERGANCIRMHVTETSEEFQIWMTPLDVVCNMVDWGPNHELEKALHAYYGGNPESSDPPSRLAPGWPSLPYTWTESAVAHAQWKASCGHHSIAAATQQPLSKVRETLDHEGGWMNPTQMGKSLQRLGISHIRERNNKNQRVELGITRIQWTGKWTLPGSDPAIAYRHTHYVARKGKFVLDTVIHPALWIPGPLWEQAIAKYSVLPPSDGWYSTDFWKFGNP